MPDNKNIPQESFDSTLNSDNNKRYLFVDMLKGELLGNQNTITYFLEETTNYQRVGNLFQLITSSVLDSIALLSNGEIDETTVVNNIMESVGEFVDELEIKHNFGEYFGDQEIRNSLKLILHIEVPRMLSEFLSLDMSWYEQGEIVKTLVSRLVIPSRQYLKQVYSDQIDSIIMAGIIPKDEEGFTFSHFEYVLGKNPYLREFNNFLRLIGSAERQLNIDCIQRLSQEVFRLFEKFDSFTSL